MPETSIYVSSDDFDSILGSPSGFPDLAPQDKHTAQRSQGSRKITHELDEADYGSDPVLHLSPTLAKKIMNAEIDWDMNFWTKLPDAYRLLKRLLAQSPSQRSTARQALGSTWIQKDLEMLEKRYKEHVIGSWSTAEVEVKKDEVKGVQS